jgi:hypothetical protein
MCARKLPVARLKHDAVSVRMQSVLWAGSEATVQLGRRGDANVTNSHSKRRKSRTGVGDWKKGTRPLMPPITDIVEHKEVRCDVRIDSITCVGTHRIRSRSFNTMAALTTEGDETESFI